MIKIIKKKVEVYALGQHICMSAHKARRIIDQICGRFLMGMILASQAKMCFSL